MHILIIPSWYPNPSNRSSGSFFREQAHALHKSGCRVGVISPNIRSITGRKANPLNKERTGIIFENDQGVPTYIYYGWNYTTRIPYGFSALNIRAGLKLFETYINMHGLPDLIHAHASLMGGLIACEIKERYKIPYIVTEHLSMFLNGTIKPWQVEISKKAFKSSERNIAVSNHLKQILEDTYSITTESWRVIPNMVNRDFLGYSFAAQENQKFRFINVASLIKRKRHYDLLYSFSKCFRGDKRVELCIVGEGPLKDNLIELAKTLKIDHQVLFLGALSREKVMESIYNSDVFILTSEHETFGVVLIEALALGRPVISTNSGGPCEIIKPKNGILTPVGDYEKISLAMTEMRDHGAVIYDRQQIRDDCKARFGEEKIINEVIKIYTSVLNASF